MPCWLHGRRVFIFTLPPVGIRSTAICVSVCLSVCLSARIFLKQHNQISRNVLHATCDCHSDRAWLGTPLTAMRYVIGILRVLWMTLVFSRNGENRPESKTIHVSLRSPGGGTGSQVCRLHLVFSECKCLPPIPSLSLFPPLSMLLPCCKAAR